MKPFRFWALFFAVLGASALAQSLSNVVTTSTFALQTTSTETRRSFTGPKFFHRPSKTLDIVETTPKVKYTRTISTPSRITANQKHTRRDVAIDNVAPTSLDELLGTSDTPGMSCSLPSTSHYQTHVGIDCIPVCSKNAWAFTNCEQGRRDCACVNDRFQTVSYPNQLTIVPLTKQ